MKRLLRRHRMETPIRCLPCAVGSVRRAAIPRLRMACIPLRHANHAGKFLIQPARDGIQQFRGVRFNGSAFDESADDNPYDHPQLVLAHRDTPLRPAQRPRVRLQICVQHVCTVRDDIHGMSLCMISARDVPRWNLRPAVGAFARVIDWKYVGRGIRLGHAGRRRSVRLG